MTVMFDNGEFWIEFLVIDAVSPLSAGTTQIQPLTTVTKTGRLCGYSCNGHTNIGAVDGQVSVFMRKLNNSAAQYGDVMNNATHELCFNNSGAIDATLPKAQLMLFMRR